MYLQTWSLNNLGHYMLSYSEWLIHFFTELSSIQILVYDTVTNLFQNYFPSTCIFWRVIICFAYQRVVLYVYVCPLSNLEFFSIWAWLNFNFTICLILFTLFCLKSAWTFNALHIWRIWTYMVGLCVCVLMIHHYNHLRYLKQLTPNKTAVHQLKFRHWKTSFTKRRNI